MGHRLKLGDRRILERRIGIRMAFVTALLAIFSLVPAYGAERSFEQQWADLITAAKAEGRLSVAAGGAPSREYALLLRYFSQKFGVKAVMTTGPANQTISKVLAERSAGRYTFDIAMLHPNATNNQLMPAHAIRPVVEPVVPASVPP